MDNIPDLDRFCKLVSQLDQVDLQNTVINRMRDHLAKTGHSFVDLSNWLSRAKTSESNPTESYTSFPVFSDPKAKWWMKKYMGKRIIRNLIPPPSVRGFVSILDIEDVGQYTTFTLSVETEYELYEPFTWTTETGSESHKAMMSSIRGKNTVSFN